MPSVDRRVPRAVWTLGFVSLLMDASSELIHGLLPVFMVSVLGASASAVGFVEGVAEATAQIAKVFSGTLSDWLNRRKELAVLGYGLAALSKPLFATAVSVRWVLGARFMDRIGKGLRGAPRDALIADLTPEPVRGAAYGLRQALDTVGAFIGPLLAMLLLARRPGGFRFAFWVAVIPAALSVLLLAFGIREPEPAGKTEPRWTIHRAALGGLGTGYWRVLALGAVFSLARFSEAFLILRARGAGLPDALAPAVLVTMNVVYALAAYPAGELSDRMDRRVLLGAGMLVLFAADVTLAGARGLPLVAVGVGLWGLHMGLTQGLLSAMVASSAPRDIRGTAFGLFNLASGLAALGSSVFAGLLWDKMGPAATFGAGAAFASLALLLSLTPP